MPKILVADDNSNIQKMVGLALKDQGIDVVAVGNGEAAVRKISDVKPDLVLADVFMPVRNGYEVCQYVKGDSALAHIPVILLVGAFDPLDEQEAQRVGADGVLKKPFVPPDPLISMVKSALARAGVAIAGAATHAHAPKEEPARPATILSPKMPTTISMPPLEEFPAAESEPAPDLMAQRPGPAPVRIDAGSQPLAFGSLLESPATDKEEEDDLSYATTSQPQLEHDWNSGEKEEEVEAEEEEEQASSWRRDGGGEVMDEEEESSNAVKDWRDAAFSDAPAKKLRTESRVPPRETPSYQEAAHTEPTPHAVITETPVGHTTATPPPTPSPTAPFSPDAWAAALSPKSGVEAESAKAAAHETEVHTPEVHTPEVRAPEVHAPEIYAASPAVEPTNSIPVPELTSEKAEGKEPWYSAVSSPWDAEAQKASKLASTWDVAETNKPEPEFVEEPESVPQSSYYSGTMPQEDPAATVDSLAPVLSEEVEEKVEEAALPAATVEAIREETQQLTGTVIMKAPPALAGTGEPKRAQPSMEDLVAKVLAQMNPEVLQAVTREILKPVVEAMVREELNQKK